MIFHLELLEFQILRGSREEEKNFSSSLNLSIIINIFGWKPVMNPLTPKITDFLTHFWPLLTKRKREYIMTKPCIFNIFGSPLSIYEVKITLPCTGKPVWRILFKKVPKVWKFFFILFFQMDKAYWSISNYTEKNR